MPHKSETYFLQFNPPISHRTEQWDRAWELIVEMSLNREVAFCYVGYMSIAALGFPSKEQAMLFKLRL